MRGHRQIRRRGRRIPSVGSAGRTTTQRCRALSADAHLNEMGITNPDNPLPVSTCALNEQQFGATLQTGEDPKTRPCRRPGRHRPLRRLHAGAEPPPTVAQERVGLQRRRDCSLSSAVRARHAATLTTAANPAAFIPPTTARCRSVRRSTSALAGKMFPSATPIFSCTTWWCAGRRHHLGRGGAEGAADRRRYGACARKSQFLHDGRAQTIGEAIALHAGQGAGPPRPSRRCRRPNEQQVFDFSIRSERPGCRSIRSSTGRWERISSTTSILARHLRGGPKFVVDGGPRPAIIGAVGGKMRQPRRQGEAVMENRIRSQWGSYGVAIGLAMLANGCALTTMIQVTPTVGTPGRDADLHGQGHQRGGLHDHRTGVDLRAADPAQLRGRPDLFDRPEPRTGSL